MLYFPILGVKRFRRCMLKRLKRAEVSGVLVKEPETPIGAEDNFALAA